MTTLATIADLARRRRDLIGQIAVMRARHRKRRPLQALLRQLTTEQLRAELRLERQQERQRRAA